LFEVVKLVNTWLKEHDTLPEAFFGAAEAEIRKFDDILGVVGIGAAGEKDSQADEIERLIAERDAARKARNFARSDEIRDALFARDIVLEDTPHGTKWKRKFGA
ncbi:MAG: cysteine--tRNA ligase, partial [Synergistaceae bacterium]|nr:cysteine--tRNA ligase [Synergistaceae bacterium]